MKKPVFTEYLSSGHTSIDSMANMITMSSSLKLASWIEPKWTMKTELDGEGHANNGIRFYKSLFYINLKQSLQIWLVAMLYIDPEQIILAN